MRKPGQVPSTVDGSASGQRWTLRLAAALGGLLAIVGTLGFVSTKFVPDAPALRWPSAFAKPAAEPSHCLDMKITAELHGAELAAIIRSLTEISGCTFVADSLESKRHSFCVNNQPISGVLGRIAAEESLDVEAVGNVVRLRSKGSVAVRYVVPGKQYSGKLVSLDLHGASIRSAVAAISRIAEQPVADVPLPDDRMTMQLMNVPSDQALDLIAEIYQLPPLTPERKI